MNASLDVAAGLSCCRILRHYISVTHLSKACDAIDDVICRDAITHGSERPAEGMKRYAIHYRLLLNKLSRMKCTGNDFI